ncbi:hypothetical protein BKG63_10980 [Mycobacteroides chelonae]|uniref:hypothetical protein n=1 Tax=Mycobacteroides chelonae TaxID=1774 RepID=UPI0008A875F1|nr:hypothetical protein [Mycobacteroides chelonae]OHT52552.1 hypothetical protein BKG63_10980 [Mycobacteroides chelonae]
MSRPVLELAEARGFGIDSGLDDIASIASDVVLFDYFPSSRRAVFADLVRIQRQMRNHQQWTAVTNRIKEAS